ncbi:hypothetical protein K469DRAFT_544981 [Zopfia rhizophila CBS 207.26]|uniref:Extracellular membrane protein CFEM domain-containing protein n=1 Tax=Zopfia rhizophila CBS 207.26 TaxID=1314779 RepID=A0A6A6EXI2_9PEZI|nr:hypothetical protein K469DRAFT_544981 [Zopfia rhizophila CBS 207.26]
MKAHITILAALFSLAHSFPSNSFPVPTCGVEKCLFDGVFYGCRPIDLVCLCKKEQEVVDRYVGLIRPCLEGHVGCTDGAAAQYKQLLTDVCETFGRRVEI